MKHSEEQMILAAHVRRIALDFSRYERNAASEKWHAENPGKERSMEEFAEELNKRKPFRNFIREAAEELGGIVDIINLPPEAPQKPETSAPTAGE